MKIEIKATPVYVNNGLVRHTNNYIDNLSFEINYDNHDY